MHPTHASIFQGLFSPRALSPPSVRSPPLARSSRGLVAHQPHRQGMLHTPPHHTAHHTPRKCFRQACVHYTL